MITPLTEEAIDTAVTERLARRPWPVTRIKTDVEVGSGQVQHFAAEVDTEAADDAVGKDLEHATSTGSYVDEIGDVHALGCREQSLFDDRVRDVKRSHLVPVTCDAFKVRGRRTGTFGTHCVQPFEVSNHRRGGPVDEWLDCVDHLGPDA